MKKNTKKRIWRDLLKLGTDIMKQHDSTAYRVTSHNTWRVSHTGSIEKNTYYTIIITSFANVTAELHINLINRISEKISLNQIISLKDMKELESLYHRFSQE